MSKNIGLFWGDVRGLDTRVTGHPRALSQEEGTDLPDFALSRAHLFL